jgi:arabinose-5-phosphate isomerase
MKVRDVMMGLDRFPVVGDRTMFKEALEAMGRLRIGIACIVGADATLKGIITDGDVRRMLLNVQKPFAALFVDDAIEHAVEHPLTVSPDDTLESAMQVMEDRGIWDLPVVNSAQRLQGLLHLHPAVKALLAERAS